MRLQEVLRTCSNAQVARAALLSIGGALGAAAAADARRRDEPLGEFVSGLVRDFESAAEPCVWTRAEQAMQASEQPVLAGLYAIVAHGLLKRNVSRRVPRRRELLVA